MKAIFGILQLPLSSSSRKRKSLLSNTVHLINWRAVLVGLNRIQTSYAKKGPDVQPWVRRVHVEQDTGSLSERHQR